MREPLNSLKDAAWLRDGLVARLLDVLNRDGEEARVVGGAVRNALLGEPISEFDIAKLTTLPSVKIKTPYSAEAPAALECRHYTTLEVSASRRLAIGEVVQIHIRGGLWDTEKMRIDMTAYRPLARLFGNFYASLSEPFTHERQSYEEWAAERKEKA